MRKVLLLLSVLFLGAAWAAAQDSTPSGQSGSATAGSETTVQGCLSASNGSYTLTDKDGSAFQLTGNTAKLSEHVGHEVKITGASASASASSGASAGTTSGANSASQTLQVSSVKHIAKTCQSGAMTK